MGAIRVAVIGAAGRMGRQTVQAVASEKDMELVGAVDVASVGEDVGILAGRGPMGVIVAQDIRAMLRASKPDVAVDFSLADGAGRRVKELLASKCRSVIGTTGISKEDLDAMKRAAQARHLGVLVAPNFAIGAVLMIKFAAEAARYMPDVEIIELHHDQKKDAPSGTALYTAERILEAKKGTRPRKDPTVTTKIPGVRGGAMGDVAIHSVRLSGFLASQEVVFGGRGQSLSIPHDTSSRDSFMPGVILAVRRIMELEGFVFGLDKIL